MDITWPTNTADVVDAIRDAIGRDVAIQYLASGIACTTSGCYYDPTTNLSTNPFCPTCSGEYWLNTFVEYTVNAHVTTKGANTPVWTVGGIVVDGDAVVQIKNTASNLSAVETSEHFIVDSRTYVMKEFSLRGVPTPNRIVVVLKEQEG
jgi:hypothetical protein